MPSVLHLHFLLLEGPLKGILRFLLAHSFPSLGVLRGSSRLFLFVQTLGALNPLDSGTYYDSNCFSQSDDLLPFLFLFLLYCPGLKVNDQLVAYATRFLAGCLKNYLWSHHCTLNAKLQCDFSSAYSPDHTNILRLINTNLNIDITQPGTK